MDKIQVQDQYWKLQTKPYHPRPEKSVKLTFQCPKKVDEQNRTCYVAQAVVLLENTRWVSGIITDNARSFCPPPAPASALPCKHSITATTTLVSVCTHECLSNLSCASYLCNHQQISQSTSGLNTARAVLCVGWFPFIRISAEFHQTRSEH